MIYFVFILLPIYCYARNGRYECGPHGRFEYCIDGIPGCVVGCHCYPGYFFDTDTKICEPSTKLTQDFRRYYSNVPIHEHGASIEAAPPPRPAPPAPAAPVVTSVLGESVKGSAELSDWLYNQFFKTIENQVINKTNEEELLQGTRRVAGPARKPKKKSAKKEKKKKKVINHGLRRKLLRITEDDSMFESSSSSESDESASSSSWESWDEPRGEEGEGGGDPPGPAPVARKEKDHGHRKIIVYNKKPKPPLPSFIFLPNVETPFYPPMGLPVPQVPMMYPMIPIPPLQAPPECYEDHTHNSSTVAPAPKTESPATTAPSTTPPPTIAPANSSVLVLALSTTTEALTSPEEEPTGYGNADEAGEVSTTTAPAPSELRKSKYKATRAQNRNNIIQAIRQRGKSTQIVKKIGTMGKNFKVTQKNHFINAEKGPPRDYNDDIYQQPFEALKPTRDDVLPIPDEIDFKYISQLIHRVEGNTSGPTVPTIEFNPDRNAPKNSMRSSRLWKPPQAPGRLQAPLPARRSIGAPAAPDDAYYTNLGRQIASLIRSLQPEQATPQPDHTEISDPPFFAENGIAPRSYWERFVRSPIKLDPHEHKKEETFLQPGSKELLYDLENQAEVAAKSSIVLSLLEIENAINAMSQVRKQQIGEIKLKSNNKPSNKSFNVSLMPRAGGKLTDTPSISKKPIMNQIADTNMKRLNISLNINMGKKRDNNNIFAGYARKSLAQHLRPNHSNARLSSSQINHIDIRNLLRNKIATHDLNKFLHRRFNATISPRQSYTKGTMRVPILKFRPPPGFIIPNNIDQYYTTRNIQRDLHTVLKGRTLKGKLKRPKYFFNDFPYFD